MNPSSPAIDNVAWMQHVAPDRWTRPPGHRRLAPTWPAKPLHIADLPSRWDFSAVRGHSPESVRTSISSSPRVPARLAIPSPPLTRDSRRQGQGPPAPDGKASAPPNSPGPGRETEQQAPAAWRFATYAKSLLCLHTLLLPVAAMLPGQNTHSK
ncbi:uncharacterized protein UV8b_00284 [Ustilaginoidea virens]|uniref:Uncharacterized protein n=1 Tax=Ustilaginoidea virens TaxID=1159556 RepID=A0A8E5HIP7_USTVR|nr:uncharacterized protein UV8b_00284 [Ustilaginoidea virens]QUC16043.1 hypothetical protein UV8b_00284 [Ustilaginoidea virens]